MKRIFCHPENWRAVRSAFKHELNGFGIEIHTNPFMEKTKPTGKYVIGGKVFEKSEIRVKHKFIEYGPEDLDWLLYAGIATEDREMLFYVVDESMFRMSMDYAPVFSEPRVFFSGITA